LEKQDRETGAASGGVEQDASAAGRRLTPVIWKLDAALTTDV
jgi:hypothetical protein